MAHAALRFSGILFWSTVYLFNYQDPWDTQWSTTFQCQGDGTMIYPGTVDHIGGTTDIPGGEFADEISARGDGGLRVFSPVG
ncbi:MAG: DUF4091 domain-containing protein [Deltaproteobacteria bacterium]|nr:DUF4091 domain-containing protein [Deltaproteobacteria bacterium]